MPIMGKNESATPRNHAFQAHCHARLIRSKSRTPALLFYPLGCKDRNKITTNLMF